MSYKQKLIKLLEQEVLTPVSAPKVRINVRKVNNRWKRRKVATRRRNRKVSKKRSTIKAAECSNGYAESTSSDSSHKESHSNNIHFVRSFPDSNIEINMPITSEDQWVNEINTNITPSKSEYGTEPLQEDIDVGVSFNNSSDIISNIFEFSDESSEEDQIIFLPDTYDEIQKEQKRSIIYNTKSGKIVILKDKHCIYIHGSFKLFVLYGSIHLLGYNLTSFCTEVEIHSLRGFSYLGIENNHEGNIQYVDLVVKDELRQRGVDECDILKILSKIEPCDTILVCSTFNNLKLPYIEKHISQKLSPAVKESNPVIINSDVTDVNTFKCCEEWDEIADTIDKSSKLMICGGKGVGKSTLLRYMINRLLMDFKSVLVIDLDPGQSEFTIPGCVSAVLVQEPIFGPSFTHLQTPERCIFVENIDITLAPDMYIESVVELLKQCENFSESPTLINYLGYSQSYGIDIVSTVITYVSPTHLLQIDSTQNTKNFQDELTPEAVANYLNLFGGADTKKLSYKFFAIDSMAEGLTSWQAHGRTIREMCVLSYFSELIDSSLSLTSRCVPLYKILLKNITLMDCNLTTVKYKAAVFNANLVTLCTTTTKSNIYNCHGWGIVRGIDQEHLVLITPVCEDVLKKVTHLAIGSVALPPSMLMYEDQNEGLIPYVSVGSIATFNNIPKRSYLPKRH